MISKTNMQPERHFLTLLSCLFAMYIIFMPKTGFAWDQQCFKLWASHIYQHGLSNVYDSGTDYLPAYHYILWFYCLFQDSVDSVQRNIHHLQIITLLFDFIAGYFLILIIKNKIDNKYELFTVSLFYFLNIFILYNTIVWGQVDSIMACFVYVSFYFATRNRILLSLILYVVAVNLKLQAIVFLPFIGLIILPTIVNRFSISKITKWVASVVSLQLLILLPFIISGNVKKVQNVLIGSFGKFSSVSVSADNIWFLVMNRDPKAVEDSEIILGLSFNQWGFILFFTISFLVLLPLILATFKAIKQKSSLQFITEKLLIIGTLIPLVFFFVNTQMHERYSHPAFIFMITYCILRERILIGLLGSIAYFLNLESVLQFFNFAYYDTFLFTPKFVACLYLITIILLFQDLYDIRINLEKIEKVLTLKYNKYIALAVLVCLPIFSRLGSLPIRIWDEARLAINAYEMHKNGNYIVTYFDGMPEMWNTKPPLFIWMQVFFMKIIGVNEVAVRLPAAIAALITCALLFFFSIRYLKNFWFGFIAALVLVTSNGYIEIHAARTGDYDTLLALFTTLGGLSYFLFIERKNVKYLYLFFVAFALAVLTKSITGLMFLPAIAIYTFWQKEALNLLKNKHFYFGILLFLAPILSYYLLREHLNPGYLKAVGENELWRYASTIEGHKNDKWFYYQNFFRHQLSAWFLFIPLGVLAGLYSKNKLMTRLTVFSAIMAALFLLIISKAQTKIDWYDVPLYPFLAILTTMTIYYIFDYLQSNATAIQLFNSSKTPFVFLFFVLVIPYQKILDKAVKAKEPPYYYNYNLSYFLKKASVGKEDCNNYFLLHEGYGGQNLFYINILKDKGINFSTKDWTKLEAGDMVIVHQQNIQDYVNNTYHCELIWQKDNVIKYKINAKK